jgi:ferric-dicitrate binding protein FerR (iron transport regulator)
MNRTDTLTDRLIDGHLTDDEAIELERLLSEDAAAKSRHLAAVRLELALRRLRTEFAFAEPTIAKIEADRVDRTTTAVMAELARRPIPGRPTPISPVRRYRMVAAIGILAAIVLVSAWFGLRPSDGLQAPVDPTPAPDFARLTAVTGSVEVVGAAGVVPGVPGQLLTRDQMLRTVGEESFAVLQFPDRTRLEVHPDSVVRLSTPNDKTDRKLVLVEGRMTTVATGKLMVVGGSTEIEAIDGSFSVCSAGAGSARVEATGGDVRVHRHGASTDPMVLGPGQVTFIPDDATLVMIDSGWRIESEPLSRLDFKALDVRFTPEGEVWAVSEKQWARWVPGAPDPGRMLFLPKVLDEGSTAWLTPDRRAVALCRFIDHEGRISVRDLPSGTERGRVPVRVAVPRHLSVAPDASWVATVGLKPNHRQVSVWNVARGTKRSEFEFEGSVNCLAASPDGRWLAIETSERVALFDPLTGKREFDLPTGRRFASALAFSADGKQLGVGFNGVIQIWDIQGRKLSRTLEGFERSVTYLAFSPQGEHIAAGIQDGQVWVWSASTGQRTQVLDTGTRGVRSLAFSADGKFLVTATNKEPVAVWGVVP